MNNSGLSTFPVWPTLSFVKAVDTSPQSQKRFKNPEVPLNNKCKDLFDLPPYPVFSDVRGYENNDFRLFLLPQLFEMHFKGC